MNWSLVAGRWSLVYVILFTILYLLPPNAHALTGPERADELFLEGNYEKAMAEADKAIAADSGKRYELYYLKGLSALKLNKFAEARKNFEYIAEHYPRSSRALDAYTGIGDAYFLEGNTQGALRSYKTAVDAFGDDKNISVVKQRITDCMARLGQASGPGERAAPKPAEKPMRHVNFTPKNKSYAHIDTPAQGAVKHDGSGQFSVQVGSFKSRSNACKLVSKLSSRHYEARIESPSAASDNLYRVKVGRTSSKEEAGKLAARLSREGYPTRVCQEN